MLFMTALLISLLNVHGTMAPAAKIQVCGDELTPYGAGMGIANKAEIKRGLNTVMRVSKVTQKANPQIAISYLVWLRDGAVYLQTPQHPHLTEYDRVALAAVLKKELIHPISQSELSRMLALDSSWSYPIRFNPHPFSAAHLTITYCTPRK